MPISRAKASARSKKGWQTRRRRGQSNIKRELKPKNLAKRGARRYARTRIKDFAENNTYQYVWQRPNGDRVKVSGYTPTEARRLRKVLTQFDARVRPEHHLDLTLEKRHIPATVQLATAGMAAGYHLPPLRDTEAKWVRQYKRETGKEPGKLARGVFRTNQRVLLGQRERNRIYIQPRLVGKPAGTETIVHEFAHAIDTGRFKYSGSKEWRDAAKWKRNARSATGLSRAAQKDKKVGYTGVRYQGVSPEEDFAETFSRAVIGTSYGKKTLDYKITDKLAVRYDRRRPGDNVTYDRPRRSYMEKHVIYPRSRKDLPKTKLKRRPIVIT